MPTKRTTESYTTTSATKNASKRRRALSGVKPQPQRVDASQGFCIVDEYTPTGEDGDT